MRILLIFTVLAIYSLPVSAIGGNQLVENANLLDGQIVTFEGEVIGDIMKRGDHAWINVNDGQRAIGIWAKKNDLNQIKISGDYTHRGDVILISGQFNRACQQHGGDLDIHARQITVLEPGQRIKHPIPAWKLPLFWLLLALTIGAQLVFFWLNKRPKA